MNIVFFSTNSNFFDGETFIIKSFPSNAFTLSELAKKHPEHSFTVVTKFPGQFLLDLQCNQIAEKAENVNYEIIGSKDSAEDIFSLILSLKPDLAITATFWTTPFDWLGLQDSLIAEKLSKAGIKTVCNSLECQKICFNKADTYNFFSSHNFNCAKAVIVDHAMYWAERNHQEIKNNFYKEAVLEQIKNLNYPVIIKDTVGLSSYGMEVVNTFGEAKNFLNSKRNNSDRIVEEFIDGTAFGVEIYGKPGNYKLLPTVMLSLNKYGITSPKQSVKIGPVNNPDFKIEELNRELFRLAETLKFNGSAQVDLIFSKGNWYFIEINPRLSGMTETYGVMYNKTLPELLLVTEGIEQIPDKPENLILNIKYPILSDEYLSKLKELPFVKYICQTENKLAKQERERGYCEVIISAENKKRLEENLQEIKEKYPEIIEPAFFETAQQLIKTIGV